MSLNSNLLMSCLCCFMSSFLIHGWIASSCVDVQPFLRSNTLPLHPSKSTYNSGERSEGTRVVKMRSACATIPKRPAGVRGENPSTWDEVYSLTG